MICLNLLKHNVNTIPGHGGKEIYVLNIPKMKTFFYSFRPVQVKSIKDWSIIIHKINFTIEDFMKHFEVIEKIKRL